MWRRTKEPLEKSERGELKADLKFSIQKTKIMATGPITSWQIDGEIMETVTDFIFLGSKITADGDCSMKLKDLLLGREAMTSLDSILKSRDISLPTKVCLVKVNSFSSSHIRMWELDCRESWAAKNWCFWSMVLENTLQSLLDCKEIQPVHPKGNWSWIFIGRTDAEAETPILWPPVVKNWLIWKDPDACKDWRWEEKGMTEDEMVGWHYWHNGHEFEEALGVGEGREAWLAVVHGVAKSRAWLSNWTELITKDKQKKISFWQWNRFVSWLQQLLDKSIHVIQFHFTALYKTSKMKVCRNCWTIHEVFSLVNSIIPMSISRIWKCILAN